MKPITVLSLFNGMSCGYIALQNAGIPVEKYYSSEIDKFAIAESQSNFPDIIQLGDVTKWREWNIDWGSIDLLMGGFPCFPAGTMIMTDKGHKDIKDIEIGDMVLTHTGNYHKVLNKGEKIAPTRIISGQGHFPIECTDDHPFYIRNRRKNVWNNDTRRYNINLDEPTWTEAILLNENSYICNVKSSTLEIPNKSKEYWYFVGRFMGDGCTYGNTEKGQYQTCICGSLEEYQELKKCFDDFGMKYTIHSNESAYYFWIYSKDLYEDLSQMGHLAHNKTLHPEIFSESIENKKEFIRGYIDSDGHFDKHNSTVKFTTVSKKIVLGMQQLILDTYGRHVTITKNIPNQTKIIKNKEVNQKPFYQVSFNYIKNKRDHVVYDNNYIWMKGVKQNYTSGEWKTVYNIEVDVDNTYTVNNIVVHNCQAWSNAGKHGGVNDIRGQLFLTMIDIFEHIKSLNPNVQYLFENVKMKKDFENFINDKIGQTPILINSQNYTAHYRQRYYWIRTNKMIIPPPLSLSPNLVDIIDDGWYTDRIKSYCIDANYAKGADPNQYFNKSRRQMVFSSPDINREALIKNGKNGVDYRKLTVVECCKLQGVNPDFFKVSSNFQAYKMLGNGWTVPVIEHLLREIFHVGILK